MPGRRRDADGLIGADRFGKLSKRARIVPIHPVAQADRLLGLAGGELQHALLAGVDELVDAVRFDGRLGAHLQFALDFDFDPEPLAIEAVLIALVVAGHREVALEDVLVGASPGVVHAHRVVGGDRPVDEAPPRLAGVLGAQLAEDRGLLPEAQHLVLTADEVGTR